MNSNLLILIIYLSSVSICCLAQDICSSQSSCRNCIQQADCVWCITQNTSTTHCLPKKEKQKCENEIENPRSEVKVTSEGLNTSIISPTEINLKIRANKPQTFDFTFTQPKEFPVDLYFLMDISYTMREHRDKLSALASEIVILMKNYTSDIRMGFGSFVDKPTSPFAYVKNGKLDNPCPAKLQCSLPYSFQNHLSLTNDTNRFSHEVNTTKLSGNIDVPEGSLEALMQAIVCKDAIGWRENARRLIILSTDTIFHIAGDGKLAGIDKPNDGLCHLDNNIYTHSLEHDYPSVGQIAEKIKENNVFVIFAVTEFAKKIYEQLKDRFHNTFIGILSAQTTIVNIMQHIFDNIANTVKINHNFGTEFNVKFASNCEKFDRLNASCPGVKPGDSISFTAKLELKKCPENDTKIEYSIYPSGLDQNISISVDYLCQCACEKTGQKASPLCSNIGELQCGICKCPTDRTGVSCECNKITNFKFLDSSNCKKGNSTEDCSGAGYCNCGQCICNKKTEERDKIYGKYCECNDNSCYDDNDAKCSNQGDCNCGICKCYSGWSGQKCDCNELNDTCVEPNSNETCSGMNGNCVCGKCECNVINGHRFFGDYCENCLTCPRCSNYRGCVECKWFKQGIYNEVQCEQKCANFTYVPIEDVDKVEEGESCSFRDDKDCVIKYKYVFNVEDNTTTLYVQQEKQECIETASIAFWAGIPILSILVAALIGLAIFKLISILQYRQEFAKFQRERGSEKNELNPLYKSPTSKVENPLYGLN